MSRVNISTAPCDPSASLVSEVRRITNLGFSTCETVFPPGSPCSTRSFFSIEQKTSSQILRNIFQASEEDAEELRRLDDLGHVEANAEFGNK